MVKKKLYIALLLLPLMFTAGSQADFMEQIVQSLKFHHLNYPQEKVYIQTDKTFYKQNERIWYKAFLLNSNDNRASEISDVIYVELLDPKGTVVYKHEHGVLNGVSNGEFLIHADAAGGLYKLVAYTQWQKNWGEEAFFKKEITVQRVITPRLLLKLDFEKRAYGPGDEGIAILLSTDLRNEKTTGSQVKAEVKISGKTIQTIESLSENGETRIAFRLPDDLNTSDGLLQVVVNERGIEESISRSIPIVLNKISLRFFPEGGELVENVQSKVAFEALNEFGKGADISGIIIDENNVEVAGFESFHLGMGAFEFTPQADKIYYAKIEKPQGNYAPVRLPQAKTSGYSLNLKSKTDTSLTWTLYAPENNRIALVGQTQGVIYYSKEINLQKGYNTVNVDLNNFPIGVAVFTLFDESNRETCERLVFVNPQKGLQINLTTDKEFYKPLEDVKLTVRTTDKDNRPVMASLGVSVVDEQLLALADDKQDNLLSYLLFSSELKGKIQEPSFYFDKNEPKAHEAIDYLMLTRGWRRFTWQEVLQANKTVVNLAAEKVNDIYGFVLDKNDKSKQTTVWLVEYGGKRRVVELKTTKDGQFAFHQVDFSGRVLILAPYSNKIRLWARDEVVPAASGIINNQTTENDKKNPGLLRADTLAMTTPSLLERAGGEVVVGMDEAIRTIEGPPVEPTAQVTDEKRMAATQESIFDTSTILFEEIVGAYGMIRTRNIVQSITARDLRGTSSMGSLQPLLFVIDGVPVSENNISDFTMLRKEDISSITILNNSDMSILGPRTPNTTILISTTRSDNFRPIKNKPAYAGVFISKREFYNPETFSQTIHNPNQENSTVYWNANVQTDKNGEASLTFKNNAGSSSFRITAEGISTSTGLIGSVIHKIATTQPFSVDVKTPLFASLGDTVRLPVLLTNTTNEPIEAKVNLILPNALLPEGSQELIVEILPESAQTVYLAFVPTPVQGEHEYTITAVAPDYAEEISRQITIRSVYFPQWLSLSGRKMNDSFSFNKAGVMVEGSFQAELVCFLKMHEELYAGLESILREPYGCFEQVSSSLFPNIMALQTMEASGKIDETIRRRAMNLLEQGYKKLIPYEVPGGGFDWYGRPPASTTLTAYGLLEFYEMSKVYNKVDSKIMERTRKFLLDRRNGKGGFENKGLVWSETFQEVCNAYVVYVLSEVKEKEDYNNEYQTALREAYDSKDMYRMALMANAAYNRSDRENYDKLIQYFENESKSKGFDGLQTQTSVTRSGGVALKSETIALWTIALLKSDRQINMEMIGNCIEYISSKRTPYGGFGNTQATILCLQALTHYANRTGHTPEQGILNLSVNGKNMEIDLTKNLESDKQISLNITSFFVQGDNNIQLRFADIEKPLPYNIQFKWEYKTPPNNDLCPFTLTTELNRTTIRRNETVRLAVTLENKESQNYPMSVAIIGIPGGMSLQAWQLKEMQEQEVFDFYEIIDDNLVLYFRSVLANERKTIHLDLKAEIPGTYTGIASTTYVYYTNENKYWINGLMMKIEE